MSDAKKIVTVFGATGSQGGGVMEALLAAGSFHVRGVTRNTDSEKAKALAERGVEMVQADQSDAEAVQKAVQGAYAVFLVTQFWEKFDPALEITQGKLAADACKAAGVEHLVFSALEDVRKIKDKLTDPPLSALEGGFVVPHFDGKGEVMDYIKESGVNATFVLVSFYFENFLGFFPPSKNEDGTFTVTMPMSTKPMGGIAVGDVGGAVATIIKEGSKHYGKEYGLAGEMAPISAYVDALSSALGVTVKYQDVPVATFASFGFPGAADLANMFGLYQNVEHCPRDVDQTRTLNPATRSFAQWLSNEGTVAALKGAMKIE
eukprot:CAMPEP_0196800262 /NCGR_PEP_ID=MMETSP1104-20130614/40052_1 /TAXON_ID=33652 /ORGANISM="Cafeteria sp., Strain Caron Lab Isolate" /LENGTH=318 /DNA_ID=CAMNT_0042170671 /DNA_START=46 /DNA_END=1002 /DNA_ORIENTATION=-